MATKIRRPQLLAAMLDPPLPPLESGDRLRQTEFERRYQAMPLVKKAELIEGVVYMGSPVRQRSHGKPHAIIMGWLVAYAAATPGVDIGDNATVRLDLDNEPQPDALLRIEPQAGGRSHIGDDDYIEGPPELVIEIAASSASYDLYDKFDAYRRNMVQEYLVWRVYDQQIDWWQLNEGDYQPIAPNDRGVVHSQVFPGLCLDVAAMLAGDIAAVLAAQQQALGAPEHQALIERLRAVGPADS